MNPAFRNVLAVLAGLVIGNIVNMGIISISGNIIPPPEGIDTSKIEDLKKAMLDGTFLPKHFIMPFLAHALGTLAGAFVVAKIAVSRFITLSMLIAVFFLLGGIMMVNMLPSPIWFSILDLGFAYFPMALIGWKLAGSKR